MAIVTITGGAGFIGSNLAHRLLRQGHDVTIFDNLSRSGGQSNIGWLREQFGEDRFRLVQADLSDFDALKRAIEGAERVYHLAGQVAVTTSVIDPRSDFMDNALGTFNALEAARLVGHDPIFIYSSTNKVYGGMEEIKIVEQDTRYTYADFLRGIPETMGLDFHSPYGCSKGAGDQYTRDYYRIYRLRSIIMRQSCLAATQEVITPFGKKAIADLHEGDLLHSGRGWTKVRRIWQTGVKPVRKLTTMNGLSVTLTEDHKVFRPHGLYSNRDFAYGDFLAVLPEARFMPQWENIPDKVLSAEDYLNAIQAKTTDRRCWNQAVQLAERLLPLQGDRLLAMTEIVGRLFGDGHLGIHHRRSRKAPAYTVQHFGSEEELKEVTQRLEWLGLSVSKIIRGSSTSELPNGHVVQGTSCRIQQQSIPIFTLFELLGVAVGDKVRVEYELPIWIANGHRLVKRAFLRGFFGAELCRVNANSYLAPSFAQAKDVDYYDSGLRWVQQLRDLIAEFGIETSFFQASPVEYKRGTTIQMTVRLLGGRQMFSKLAEIGYAFTPKRSAHLNALLRWHWTHTTPEHFDSLESLYRADGMLYWDSLATTEVLGDMPVYDLEVEDQRHLFLAGGIQVSNCIYGYRQFGIEDQGWIAWFIIAALKRRPITIYGDGKQVRDALFIEDLLDAYDSAIEQIDQAAGQVYNVGGGPDNTLSIWVEFAPMLEKLLGRPIPFSRNDWRPGDQPVYISNIDKIKNELGWQPQIGVQEGITRLFEWIRDNQHLFGHL